MKPKKDPKSYEPLEEKLNVYSHGFGLLLSIAALVLLVVKASIDGSPWRIVSFSIFGVSMIVLYTASTIFHNAKDPVIRKRLNIFDHASIYVLIAGSYTPFTLVTLNGTLGWVLFGISWGIAIAGVILKLFYTGKYEKASTIAYVLMGWMIVFAIKPLIANLASEGLLWLVWGGVSYTVGAILYSINKLKFNHIIFHIFVLIGSFCHFMAVYFYV
ncbi:MAG: hemolysin D [Flavobacterium sp.]|nr:MAG: hemolysin D [Flavobacterium sp.]